MLPRQDERHALVRPKKLSDCVLNRWRGPAQSPAAAKFPPSARGPCAIPLLTAAELRPGNVGRLGIRTVQLNDIKRPPLASLDRCAFG
jgi:hypothetical protein